MKCYFVIYTVFNLFLIVMGGKRKIQGKVSYEANMVGGFKLCSGAEKSVVDISRLVIAKESPTTTAVRGDFEYIVPIEDGTKVEIIIDRDTAQGKILISTLEVLNICNHIKDQGEIWTPLFEAMNLESPDCPLPARVYPMNDLRLNTSQMNEYITKENLGEYTITVQMTHSGKGLDVVEHLLSCYTFGATIEEVRESE